MSSRNKTPFRFVQIPPNLVTKSKFVTRILQIPPKLVTLLFFFLPPFRNPDELTDAVFNVQREQEFRYDVENGIEEEANSR